MSQTTWSASIRLGDPIKADGMRLMQGAAEKWPAPDKTVVPAHFGGRPCHRTAPTSTPRRFMGYWRGANDEVEGTVDSICFALETPPAGLPEAYVTVEFCETEIGWLAVHYARAGEGFVHHVCTPDRRSPWDHTWVNTADTRTWQRATIRLVEPVFDGSGPLGADIRLTASGPMHLSSVVISTERPPDFDETDQLSHARRIERLLRPKYPKAAVPVSVGNIGGIFGNADIAHAQDVTPWLPIYKAMGITAIQSYVGWCNIEKTEGHWDWSYYDWVVEQAKRFGLKWIAFIMIGPWYAMPKWWLETPNNYRNKCLEHGEESWVQSIWNPVLLDYVDRFMKKFAEHYPEEIIESVMIGIAGDYGESTTNGVFIGRNYHTHVGYWCGEKVAVDDFRRKMRERYGSIAALNKTWKASYSSFDEVRPLLHEDAPSDRMWLDQVNWYVDRMTWWLARWGEIVRAALPNTVIYNAAGGPGDPPHAGTWSGQTKVLVPTGIGARVTNEGGDYAHNFAYTSWQGTCCRFYKTPFGNEPWGGDMSGVGDLGRIYNAITQHATNLWFYDGHVRPPNGRLALQRGLAFLDGQYRRTNRVAVYYPWTHFILVNEHGFSDRGPRDKFWPQVEELRDIIDFDLVDDRLVADGIMADYDFLIVLQGIAYEREELERLAKWVEGGGILITHNQGIPTTVEGDLGLGMRLMAFASEPSEVERKLGARIAKVGKGRTVMYNRSANLKGWHGDDRWPRDYKDHPATHPGFWTTVSSTLAHASALGTEIGDYPVIDGEKDEVFGALMEHGILYFSQVEREVTKRPCVPGKGTAEVVVPPGQLLFVPFSDLA